MKVNEILNETPMGKAKDDEIRWQENPSGRSYWVKGISKKGEKRRWGPFKNREAADEFKKSRSDIRSSQIAFE